jgi:hypothetical protein
VQCGRLSQEPDAVEAHRCPLQVEQAHHLVSVVYRLLKDAWCFAAVLMATTINGVLYTAIVV